jgi:hypothetical protein
MTLSTRLAVGFCLLVVSSAAAQPNRNRNWNQQAPRNLADLREVQVSGKLESVEKGMLMIKVESTPCVVIVQPQSKLGVSGTAQADYLKPGQLITFTADVDKKGQVAEPLKELRITVPSETTRPGLFNEDRDNKESTKFYVCATVRTFKDGKLTASAGGKPVQATVAEDATIKYEGTDLAVLKAGDTISATGGEWYRFDGAKNPPQPQVVIAKQVDVTLSEPLSGKKKPPAKGKS